MPSDIVDAPLGGKPPTYTEPAVDQQVISIHDSDSEDTVEMPTEEELHTLRRVSDKIPWQVYTIAFVELCERFSFYGTTVVCKSTVQSSLQFATNILKSPTSSNNRFRLDQGLEPDSPVSRVH